MFLTFMPGAQTNETDKILNFHSLSINGEKKLVFSKNVRHFVICSYIFKIAVRALSSVILNLKLFEFFVVDGASPRFQPAVFI